MVRFIDEMRARRERSRAEAGARREKAAIDRSRAEWQARYDDAVARLDLAMLVAEGDPSDIDEDIPILLKKGELPVLVVRPVGLIEMGREGGTYQGGSHGVSIRVAKGVSYRVGAHKGTFVPGPEVIKVVDEGTVVVTTQRVVFQGAGKTREWLFAKLIGIDHSTGSSSSMLHVSNR